MRTGSRSGSNRCARTASKRFESIPSLRNPQVAGLFPFRPFTALACGKSKGHLGGLMWVVRFSDKQLEVVRAVLRSEEHRGPALEGALEALDLARWDDLPEAQLPWGEVEAEASKQGVSEADVIWDRSGRHDEPAVPPIGAKSRVKRKGKQAA